MIAYCLEICCFDALSMESWIIFFDKLHNRVDESTGRVFSPVYRLDFGWTYNSPSTITLALLELWQVYQLRVFQMLRRIYNDSDFVNNEQSWGIFLVLKKVGWLYGHNPHHFLFSPWWHGFNQLCCDLSIDYLSWLSVCPCIVLTEHSGGCF